MKIYHVVLPEVWDENKNKEFYKAESLDTEGFIHCSFIEQLEGVLDRYYQDVDKLVILEIETERLVPKLVKEPSTDDEIYPHVYGEINIEAILRAVVRKQ